jgi:hypothetical protein
MQSVVAVRCLLHVVTLFRAATPTWRALLSSPQRKHGRRGGLSLAQARRRRGPFPLERSSSGGAALPQCQGDVTRRHPSARSGGGGLTWPSSFASPVWFGTKRCSCSPVLRRTERAAYNALSCLLRIAS